MVPAAYPRYRRRAPDPACRPCRGPNMVEHPQPGGKPVGLPSTGQVHEKVLQPGAVDTVIAHPPKWRSTVGALSDEKSSAWRPSGRKTRRWITFRRRILGHVGPQLERQQFRAILLESRLQ